MLAALAYAPESIMAAERLRLAKSVPEHRDALPADPDPLRSTLPSRAAPERQHRTVYVLTGRLRDLATPDRDLTAACRRGSFMQRLDHLFGVRSMDTRPLGVAFGSGVNLHDPERRGSLDLVYFFDRQDTTLCTVWTARLDAMAPFLVDR